MKKEEDSKILEALKLTSDLVNNVLDEQEEKECKSNEKSSDAKP